MDKTVCKAQKLVAELFIVHRALSTAGVGHTKTMMQGLQNVPEAMALFHSKEFGGQVCSQYKTPKGIRPIGLHSLKHLRGSRLPLVIDNEAMVQLLSKAIGMINELGAIVTEYTGAPSEERSMTGWDARSPGPTNTPSRFSIETAEMKAGEIWPMLLASSVTRKPGN